MYNIYIYIYILYIFLSILVFEIRYQAHLSKDRTQKLYHMELMKLKTLAVTSRIVHIYIYIYMRKYRVFC